MRRVLYICGLRFKSRPSDFPVLEAMFTGTRRPSAGSQGLFCVPRAVRSCERCFRTGTIADVNFENPLPGL